MPGFISFSSVAFILTLLFVSCDNNSPLKPTDPVYKAIDSLNTNSQFSVDIPLDKTHRPDLFYRESLSSDSILNIPSFRSAEDELFINVSSDFDGTGNRQYLIIQLQKGKWKASKIKISPGDKKTLLSYKKEIVTVYPEHGWRNLSENLIKLNLFFIPTKDKVKELDLAVAHSEVNTFSIQTKHSTRFYYYYGEVTLKKVNDVHCKNTLAIIQLLRSEFFED